MQLNITKTHLSDEDFVAIAQLLDAEYSLNACEECEDWCVPCFTKNERTTCIKCVKSHQKEVSN